MMWAFLGMIDGWVERIDWSVFRDHTSVGYPDGLRVWRRGWRRERERKSKRHIYEGVFRERETRFIAGTVYSKSPGWQ
jgi:hypothetical protein